MFAGTGQGASFETWDVVSSQGRIGRPYVLLLTLWLCCKIAELKFAEEKHVHVCMAVESIPPSI